MTRSTVLWVVAVLAVVLGAGVLLGRGRASGPPLDPSSTEPLGTRALVELVERFGADVTRRLPDDGGGGGGGGGGADDPDAVLVLRDQLGDGPRQRLLDQVRRGAVLVVADPSSPLARPVVDSTTDATLAAGTCTVPGLAELDRIRAGSFLLRAVEPGEASCFGQGDRAWLVARAEGAGTVVLLGGAAPLVNDHLDEADNAAVVTALLAPAPGARVVVVYDPVAGEGGPRTLTDLVPHRVWWGIAQLGVAFASYVLWRARRFGRPVTEPQAVELPGSLLVRARGDLYRRSRSHQRVADVLRRDAGRRIRRELSLAPDAPLPVGELAARTDRTGDEVEALLTRPLHPASARDVVRLAEGLDDVLERLERDAAPARDPDAAPDHAVPRRGARL